MKKKNEIKQSAMLHQKMIFKTKSIDEENYIIRGVFSTSAEDRQGEIVDQTGWKIKEFMQNPVILLFHDHYEFPVGKCIELSMDGNGNLEGAIQFAVEEYEVAKTAFALYKGGFMRAFSVGFQNEVYEIDQEKDTVILKENTLYEISCVNVPANAMALAYSKGIDCSPIMNLRKKTAFKKNDKADNISQSNIETILSAIKALPEALKAEVADKKVVKKVEHPVIKAGGTKKISVALLNKAVRELLAIKKTL